MVQPNFMKSFKKKKQTKKQKKKKKILKGHLC